MSVAGPNGGTVDTEAFERDGYVVIDPQLGDSTIAAAVEDVTRVFEGEGGPALVRALKRPVRRLRRLPPTHSYRDDRRVQDAWARSKSVLAIARAPRILDALRSLYGREPLPFQTLNFRLGSQQQPHADAFHFNSDPPGYMCGVWVALEDIDDDNGPLVYYPGSHRLPEVTTEVLGVPPGEEVYGRYEEHVQAAIAREGLEAHHAHLRRGQALIWASNLLHGGALQRDPGRTRWTQVTHYFFEGTRYWTPMRSSADSTEWRQPAWVK